MSRHAPLGKFLALPMAATPYAVGQSMIRDAKGGVFDLIVGDDHEERAHAIARALNFHDRLVEQLDVARSRTGPGAVLIEEIEAAP